MSLIGFAALAGPLTRSSPAAETAVDHPFRLRVLDEVTGQPLAGVTLTFQTDVGEIFKTKTSDTGEGHYVYPAACRFAYLVANDHATHVPMSIRWNPTQESTPDHYDLKLPAGTKIGGLVKDDAGKPISGATVVFDINGDHASAWPHQGPDISYVHAKSDIDGKWAYLQAPVTFKSAEVGAWDYQYVANVDAKAFSRWIR